MVHTFTDLLVFGVGHQSSETVSHCHSRHPSVEGNGDDEISHHCQPVDARLHVLPEETAHSLSGDGGEGEDSGESWLKHCWQHTHVRT